MDHRRLRLHRPATQPRAQAHVDRVGVRLQSTYVRWKRGHAHTAEEGSSHGDEADPDRPELSSSEDDDEDVFSEAAPTEQPSGAGPGYATLMAAMQRCLVVSTTPSCRLRNARGALTVAMTLSNYWLREFLQCVCAVSNSMSYCCSVKAVSATHIALPAFRLAE